MTTAIFITARMKSKRLPQKLILEIKGKTIIEHLIERLKLSRLADFIVLCTSTNPEDRVLVDIAEKCGIKWFRGSEGDVLDRYLNAALKFKVDYIISLTADGPFTDPIYIDKTIELYKKTNADFITCKELPHGAYSYGIKFDALKKVCEIKDEANTEVWGGYFTKTGLFKVEDLKVDDPDLRQPEIRMTLDYEDDFKFFKEVFEKLYAPDKIFSLKEIMKLLKEHPEIVKINEHCEELYKEHVKKSAEMKLRKEYQKVVK
jgi:spore coat polysaccharide biosynthesis protein SpsF